MDITPTLKKITRGAAIGRSGSSWIGPERGHRPGQPPSLVSRRSAAEGTAAHPRRRLGTGSRQPSLGYQTSATTTR